MKDDTVYLHHILDCIQAIEQHSRDGRDTRCVNPWLPGRRSDYSMECRSPRAAFCEEHDQTDCRTRRL